MKFKEVSKILLISTGGTIEKTYSEEEGSLKNRESQIQILLQEMRTPYTEIEVRVILAKDSLDLDDNDRDLILKELREASSLGHPIVVLHGTDTMDKTINFIDSNLSPSVPIIFTGAMRPLDMRKSDAVQNVLEALALSKVVDPGVYLSFHNQLFKAPKVRKNRDLGTFEESL